jgi:hypothetical protein
VAGAVAVNKRYISGGVTGGLENFGVTRGMSRVQNSNPHRTGAKMHFSSLMRFWPGQPANKGMGKGQKMTFSDVLMSETQTSKIRLVAIGGLC